ncbi:MAG: hypothetical protein ACP5ER_05550, partial [Candidatus Bathyarchaeales archaeon]
VANNIRVDMMRRELKEITDYVSNTLANLYFLVNSTNCLNVNVTKELLYLPSAVENSVYTVEIEGNAGNAPKITAYLKDRPSVAADAWLVPGLKVGTENSVESGGRTVVAGCSRNGTGVYVWIKYRYG